MLAAFYPSLKSGRSRSQSSQLPRKPDVEARPLAAGYEVMMTFTSHPRAPLAATRADGLGQTVLLLHAPASLPNRKPGSIYEDYYLHYTHDSRFMRGCA